MNRESQTALTSQKMEEEFMQIVSQLDTAGKEALLRKVMLAVEREHKERETA